MYSISIIGVYFINQKLLSKGVNSVLTAEVPIVKDPKAGSDATVISPDTILGYQYSYSPNGFFQINLPVYEMALKEIKQHISTQKVLDLYSGVGTIGLSVARDLELTLVECDKHAFNELEKNVKQAKPNNHITTSLAKSEAVTEYITPNQTVILDPPRAGCDTKLIEKLNQEKPNTIIYLSCNPTTQARDVKMLLDRYKIDDVKTFNFFPRTPHIENLVILSLK